MQGGTAPAGQQLEGWGSEGVVRGAVQLEVEQPALQHCVVRPRNKDMDLEEGVVLLMADKDTRARVPGDLVELLPDQSGRVGVWVPGTRSVPAPRLL